MVPVTVFARAVSTWSQEQCSQPNRNDFLEEILESGILVGTRRNSAGKKNKTKVLEIGTRKLSWIYLTY